MFCFFVLFCFYQSCPTLSKTTGARAAPAFPASTRPRAGHNTWHPPLESPWGTEAQLPQGWTLSIPDGQHPACTRIPREARAAVCSQRCRFSSHGAGQEGFAAPQDRPRSEATPAPGGWRSSGHSQPEGHGQDHSTLLLPLGWGTRPNSWDCHARRDSWLAASDRLRSRQREEAGPGEAAGSEPRAWLRYALMGRRAQQPCPGRQGLSLVYLLLPPSWAPQTLITSCRSIPGPLCNPPPLPAAAAPPDRSSRSPRPDPSQQDLAGSLPASCPVPAAPGLRLSIPPSTPVRGPPGRRLCPGGSPAPGLAPCPAGAPGRARQPQPAGPGGWLSHGDARQTAHDTTSSSAGWSPPGPGRVGMLRATSIPCSSCCGKLATPLTTLSPPVGSPGRTPLQGVAASPRQGRRAA